MFRPWGLLNWTFGLSNSRKWRFVGCLGTEERSIAAYLELARQKLLAQQTLLRVEESRSPYQKLALEELRKRAKQCSDAGLSPAYHQYQLNGPITEIEALTTNDADTALVLDITSMPKRVFFFLLKKYFLSDSVRDLMITYTIPQSYPGQALSEDQDPWDALPTFRQPDPQKEAVAHRRLIVNMGFMPDGLVSHLEGPAEERQIDLILPFPAPVAAVQRSWQSVWALSSSPDKRFNEFRVGANDLSEAFQLIVSLLPSDSNLVSFAPFGPKPISAAMCLYASLTGSPVYYAQPKVYLPNYSLGISTVGNQQEIYAYWIKHSGNKLYDLPTERTKLNA